MPSKVQTKNLPVLVGGLVFVYAFAYFLAGGRGLTVWALFYWLPMIVIRLLFWLGLGKWKTLTRSQVKFLGRTFAMIWVVTAVAVLLARDELVYPEFPFPLWAKALGIVPLGIGIVFSAWAVSTLGIRKLLAVPVLNFEKEPKANDEIVISGPYRMVRHPLYFGEILSLIGIFVIGSSPTSLILLFVWTGVAVLVTTIEEVDLKKRIGEKYEEYSKNVGRLVPKLNR